jgi:hypothetical protein
MVQLQIDFLLFDCLLSKSPSYLWALFVQVIELQLPSFFNNFDPRAAAANFPSSNWPSLL